MKLSEKKFALIPIILLTAVLAVFSACLFVQNGVAAYAEEGDLTVSVQPTAITMFYGDGEKELRVEASYAAPQNLRYKWQFLAAGAENTESNWIDVKESEEGVYSVGVPADSGAYRCVVYDVTDETVSATTDAVSVTVNKASVDIIIDDKASYFGDEEEELTYAFKTALSDEEKEKITVMPLKRANAENKGVGKYVIEDGGYRSDYYIVKFTQGVYSIEKRPIRINVAQATSVYGDPIAEIPYEIGAGTLADGDTLESLKIELTKIANGANAGKYPVTGVYDNANYDVTFRPATYCVTPKVLDVRLIGTSDLVYNGEAPKITGEIIGERPENLTVTVTFDKAVKNAGSYKAYPKLSDGNYTVSTAEIPFVVKKRNLTIGLEDIIANEGAEYEAEFTYHGFAEGEDADDLDSLPVLSSMPTGAGYYTVSPAGAASDNYEIEYLRASLQINVTKAEGSNAVFTGSFRPNTDTIDLSGDGSEILNEHFKRIDRLFVYSVQIPSDGIYGEYTAQLSGVEKFVPIFLRACIIDEEGNKVVLEDYGYDKDGNFVFKADAAGVLVIYYNLLIPAVIVAVFVVLFLIIFIKKSRDKKRYQKAYVGHYVARQYAADMVNRNRENY